MARRLFVDVEAVPSVRARREEFLLLGYAVDGGEVEQLTYRDFEADESNRFSPEAYEFLDLLQSRDVIIASHGAFDVRWLMWAGLDPVEPYHDTMVMAWLVNENTPLDLDWLASRYSGIDMDKRLKRSGGRVWFRDDDDNLHLLDDMRNPGAYALQGPVWRQFADYNVRDVEALRELYWDLHERLDEADRLKYFEQEEAPYSGVLRRMEGRGLPVDLPATAELAKELTETMEDQRRKLLEDGGLPDSFNLNSQPQLVAYLFSRQVRLKDRIHLDEWEMGAYKSCIAGEHDECDIESVWEDDNIIHTQRPPAGGERHVKALAEPPGFTVEHVGREYLDGYWSVKGRNLAPTPPPVDKVTGKQGKLPSTSSPELLYMHASDPWVRELCTGYRKLAKLLNTYLLKFPKIAVEVGAVVRNAVGGTAAPAGGGG